MIGNVFFRLADILYLDIMSLMSQDWDFLSEANKINFNLKKLGSAGLRTILRPINLTSFT